ncbi:MAG: hypothetical protein K2K98_00595 [Muribaculaceae bacterium]|nr:hypothetical protein [Muribaculaceae bacterium]
MKLKSLLSIAGVVLFFVGAIVSCGPSKAEREEAARQDSIRIADSIAKAEEEARLAAIEAARQDSIRIAEAIAKAVEEARLAEIEAARRNWCVGKWSGQLNTSMNEKYVIRIYDDHTCKIKAEWFHGGVRSSDFEADWEPVSENIIKIYDYDGHNEVFHDSFNGINERRISRWSMHLRNDGAFSHEISTLDNPSGYLNKQ